MRRATKSTPDTPGVISHAFSEPLHHLWPAATPDSQDAQVTHWKVAPATDDVSQRQSDAGKAPSWMFIGYLMTQNMLPEELASSHIKRDGLWLDNSPLKEYCSDSLETADPYV